MLCLIPWAAQDPGVMLVTEGATLRAAAPTLTRSLAEVLPHEAECRDLPVCLLANGNRPDNSMLAGVERTVVGGAVRRRGT